MRGFFTALAAGALLIAGGGAVSAQAPRTVEQTPTPAGTLRARTQVQPQLRMPNLIGQSLPAARQDQRVVEWKLRLVTRELPTGKARPGTIVGQEPAPDSVVKAGQVVAVQVAVAEPQRPEPERNPARIPERVPERIRVPTVEVPRLVGMQAKDGIDLLAKLGLEPQAQFTATARAEAGTILDQKPAPGTSVRPKTPVQILVVRAGSNPELPPGAETGPSRGSPPAQPPQAQLFQMPDLVGRAFPQAEQDPRVTQLRLRLNQQLDTRAGGLPNTIVGQSVPPGAGVPLGQPVTVFVASGVAVPRVVQQQADAAEARITAAGLSARRDQEVSELPPGTVLRQVPEPGVLVARGAAVGITVAVPPKVVIPNVVGRSRSDAIEELTRLRLRPSPAADELSTLPPEQVIAQVPVAGTEVVVGGAVRITVAAGVEVPDVNGLTAAQAQRAVAARGLSFRDAGQENGAAIAGRVFQQQPAPGTRVTRGSLVTATVAVAVQVAPPAPPALPERQPPPAATGPGPAQGPPPFTATPAAMPPAAGTPAVENASVPAVNAPPASSPPARGGSAASGVPVAIPVEPWLPPWLLSLLVAAIAIAVSTVRLWWPTSSPPPPIQAATAAVPAAIDVRPEAGDAALRLEVSGRTLIVMDVRVRVQRGPVDGTIAVAGDALITDERRLYE